MKIIIDHLIKRGFNWEKKTEEKYLLFEFLYLGCHGCHALLDEKNPLLHQYYLRLGFVDIPNIEQNDHMILVGKQF